MYNSKKPHIHTRSRSHTLTHILMHTPAQDSETWVPVLALPLTCCVTWQKTCLPLSRGSPLPRGLVSLSWFRGGQGIWATASRKAATSPRCFFYVAEGPGQAGTEGHPGKGPGWAGTQCFHSQMSKQARSSKIAPST